MFVELEISKMNNSKLRNWSDKYSISLNFQSISIYRTIKSTFPHLLYCRWANIIWKFDVFRLEIKPAAAKSDLIATIARHFTFPARKNRKLCWSGTTKQKLIAIYIRTTKTMCSEMIPFNFHWRSKEGSQPSISEKSVVSVGMIIAFGGWAPSKLVISMAWLSHFGGSASSKLAVSGGITPFSNGRIDGFGIRSAFWGSDSNIWRPLKYQHPRRHLNSSFIFNNHHTKQKMREASAILLEIHSSSHPIPPSHPSVFTKSAHHPQMHTDIPPPFFIFFLFINRKCLPIQNAPFLQSNRTNIDRLTDIHSTETIKSKRILFILIGFGWIGDRRRDLGIWESLKSVPKELSAPQGIHKRQTEGQLPSA